MRAVAALACALLAAATAADAKVCPRWAPATQVGTLDVKIINEASGLDISRAWPSRLYHNNDSGDGLRLYITDMAGGGTRTVNLKGPHPLDIEDLSLGRCGLTTCLYLGDIGDNPGKRAEVIFTIVREKKAYAEAEAPLRVIRARYPDGPHNTESFAIHPNGDLYLVTKSVDALMTKPAPVSVFRLKAAQLRDAKSVQTFEKVGELDLPKMVPGLNFFGYLPTGLDFTTDGQRAILLTYQVAIELGADLSKGLPAAWTLGDNLQVVRNPPLGQQEAVAWLNDGSGILYETELAQGQKAAPIMQALCAD